MIAAIAPLFISLDGLFEALILLALYALVLLLIAVFALMQLMKRRFLLGGGIIVALLVFGLGPSILADIEGDRLDARLTDLSHWPETLDLQGRNIAFVSHMRGGCDTLCRAAVAYSGAEAVYVITTFSGDLTAEGGALETTGIRAFTEGRVVQLTETPPVTPGDLPWADSTPLDELPEVDYLILLDDFGNLTARAPRYFGLEPAEAEDIASGVYVFDGWPDPGAIQAPIARMLIGQRRQPAPFFPFDRNRIYTPSTDAYAAAWQRWLCGYETLEHSDPCRYIY